jgi:hypothetical protein
MRSGVSSKFVALSVPAAALFVWSGPAFAHSTHHHATHHHHAYRHHALYARHHGVPAQANGFAAPGFAGSAFWNSSTFASPYAQNSFGQAPVARRPLYNVSAMPTGEASASGLPASLIQRVIARESGGNPRAVHAGNYGLMQIRLGTARAMGYTGSAAGLLDPQTNMTYGLRYLAGAYRAAGGNENRAIALYQRGYYYQAKAQGFSAYGFSPYGSGTTGLQPAFQAGPSQNWFGQSAQNWGSEQYGVRHRRHYRV